MKRYTKKSKVRDCCKINGYKWADNSYNHSKLGIDKLGELEDFGEELGIDLLLLLKAVKYGFYFKTNDTILNIKPNNENNIVLELSMTRPWFILFLDTKNESIVDIDVNGYGKNWALTERELDKDNK